MRIYIAASWKDRPTMRKLRSLLVADGHTVTSTWLDWPEDNHGLSGWDSHQKSAMDDLSDIESANLVLISTRVPSSRGGFHTELGYALGLGKMVAIIGPRPSNFFYHPAIMEFEDWPSVLVALKGLRDERD